MKITHFAAIDPVLLAQAEDEFYDQFHGLGEYHDAGPLHPSRQHSLSRKCVNASAPAHDADAAASPPTDAATSGAGGSTSTLDLIRDAKRLAEQAYRNAAFHDQDARSSIHRTVMQLGKTLRDLERPI